MEADLVIHMCFLGNSWKHWPRMQWMQAADVQLVVVIVMRVEVSCCVCALQVAAIMCVVSYWQELHDELYGKQRRITYYKQLANIRTAALSGAMTPYRSHVGSQTTLVTAQGAVNTGYAEKYWSYDAVLSAASATGIQSVLQLDGTSLRRWSHHGRYFFRSQAAKHFFECRSYVDVRISDIIVQRAIPDAGSVCVSVCWVYCALEQFGAFVVDRRIPWYDSLNVLPNCASFFL